MSYYLFVAGTDFVCCLAYAKFADAEADYFAAVAKTALRLCAAEAVVLMTRDGRVIYEMC